MFKNKFYIILISLLAMSGCATTNVDNANINKEIIDTVKKEDNLPIRVIPEETIDIVVPVIPEVVIMQDEKKNERRFNFIVDNIPFRQVYTALVDETSYSVILPEDMTGNVSLNLKKVTAYDVLEILKKNYGFDYAVDGKKIIVESRSARTKIFTINHPVTIRNGASEVRVISGSVSDSPQSSSSSNSQSMQPTSTSSGIESSKILTTSKYDFWAELEKTIKAMVTSDGSYVSVSPLTNTLVVKGLPKELGLVDSYLKKIQAIVNRQVVIEAKIIEVQLAKGFQSGINWSAFNSGKNGRISAGFIGSNTSLSNNGKLVSGGLSSNVGQDLINAATNSGLLGVAFQASNFATMLKLLEQQGEVNVLSSPRIAALNNQRALLKVGTDDFFVTNITNSVTSSITGTTNSPSIKVQPFFSGIALDITPQIDDQGMVAIHIHPSISEVTTSNKVIDLGAAGVYNLPLASSSINETDTVVRVADNNIVAIGGLMKRYVKNNNSAVPFASAIPIAGEAFRDRNENSLKYELVILLKPRIVHSQFEWNKDLDEVRRSLSAFDKSSNVVIIEKNKK